MAYHPINLLLLDADAMSTLAGLISSAGAASERLHVIPEDREHAEVTMTYINAVATAIRDFGEHIKRCDDQYKWITEQLNPAKPMIPT